ncbi:MAG: transporter [Gemmatimonadetes bacterium]|nr:transporter [Gemmatimonadota bacterium]
MRHPSVVLAAVLLTGACASVPRQDLEPLVTDRPDFTESSETVAPGMAQLESGATVQRVGEETGTTVGEALLRVGLAPRAELRLGFNSYAVVRSPGVRQQGLEDASVGAKLGLVNGGGVVPKMSLIVASSVPTGAQTFRADKLQPEMKLTAAWDLSDRVAFSSNLNYSWIRDEFDTVGEVAATGSFGFGLTDKLGLYTEYFGFFPQQAFSPASHYSNLGFTWVFNPNLQLDVRGGIGHNGLGRRDVFSGIGVSRRW